MTGRRAGAGAVGMTVGAVGLMLLMIMFAARTGPQKIVNGPLHDPSIRPVDPSYTPPVPPRGPQRVVTGALHGSPFFTAVGWAIKLALVAAVLWLVYRGIRRLLEALDVHRKAKPKPVPHVDFDVLDDPEPLAEEMRRDAAEQFELLLAGHPRNAIVAAWDRFEEQAERVGAARKDWETSSEFTLRLLGAVSADPAAVRRLEDLYREARFSDHEMGEPHRQSAVGALRDIHASLGVGAGRA